MNFHFQQADRTMQADEMSYLSHKKIFEYSILAGGKWFFLH